MGKCAIVILLRSIVSKQRVVMGETGADKIF